MADVDLLSEPLFLSCFDDEDAALRGGSVGGWVVKGEASGELSFELPPVIMIFPAEAVIFSQPGLEATAGGPALSFFRVLFVGTSISLACETSSFGPGLFSRGMSAPVMRLLMDDLRRCSGRGDDVGERELNPSGEALPEGGLSPRGPYEDSRDPCSDGELRRGIVLPLSSYMHIPTLVSSRLWGPSRYY